MNFLFKVDKINFTPSALFLLFSILYLFIVLMAKAPHFFHKNKPSPPVQTPQAHTLAVITLPTLNFKLKGVILSQTGNQAVIAKNNQEILVVKGDELQTGVYVHEICSDTVKLSYKNQIFHLNITDSAPVQTLLADKRDTAASTITHYIPPARKPLRLAGHQHWRDR